MILLIELVLLGVACGVHRTLLPLLYVAVWTILYYLFGMLFPDLVLQLIGANPYLAEVPIMVYLIVFIIRGPKAKSPQYNSAKSQTLYTSSSGKVYSSSEIDYEARRSKNNPSNIGNKNELVHTSTKIADDTHSETYNPEVGERLRDLFAQDRKRDK